MAMRQQEAAAIGREASMARSRERADQAYIMAAAGLPTRDIADWLGVSPRQVQRYLAGFEDV